MAPTRRDPWAPSTPEEREALDPATPPERLAVLAGQEAWIAEKVARNPEAPPALLADLANHPDRDVRAHVAEHPRTPPPVLGQLAGDEEAWVRDTARRHRATPPEALLRLRRAGAEKGWQGHRAEHHPVDPTLPEADLLLLAKGRSYARRLAARHPRASAELVELLAQDPDDQVRAAAASHPRLSVSSQERLARAPSSRGSVQHGLACNPGASEEVLRALDLTDSNVAHAVASHPAAPSDLLETLVDWDQGADSGTEIRALAARHPRTSKEARTRASRDAQVTVRAAVAQAPETPEAVLALLLTDPAPAVRSQAALNPSAPPSLRELLWRAGASRDLRWFARPDPDLDPASLTHLFDTLGQGLYTCAVVARHPRTPPMLLSRLAQEPEVAWHVAWNPATPPELLARLVEAAEPRVLTALLLHPQAPPALLARARAEAERQGLIPPSEPRDVPPVELGVALSLHQGVSVGWYVSLGQWVQEGENLFCLDFDTHSLNVEAPCSGVLTEAGTGAVLQGHGAGEQNPESRYLHLGWLAPGLPPTRARGALPPDAPLELRRVLANVEAWSRQERAGWGTSRFVRHAEQDRPGRLCFAAPLGYGPEDLHLVWTDGHAVTRTDPATGTIDVAPP